jgi:hypothetical protein
MTPPDCRPFHRVNRPWWWRHVLAADWSYHQLVGKYHPNGGGGGDHDCSPGLLKSSARGKDSR